MPTDTSRWGSLQEGRLSPWETLGQSLASIAPTATPAMVAPLVLAVSGKGAWLAYALATLGVVAIAAGINVFARRSASPGSLYGFVHESLGKWSSLITGWALVIAYAGTAAAVTGGFTSYAYALLRHGGAVPVAAAAMLTALVVCVSAALAYRDLQISVRLMLFIEAASITLIVILFVWPGPGSALQFDITQFKAVDLSGGHVRAGLVLAIFSFVGFESAASLGGEALHPLRTIPRTISLTGIVSGLFFVFVAYAEVIGFGDQLGVLAQSSAPLQLLAHRRQLDALAPWLEVGSAISFFACTLACINAAGRTLYALARDGHLHTLYARAHPSNRTPHTAIVLSAVLVAVPALALIAAGVGPFDIYGLVGTVATYGFITAYVIVTLAAVRTLLRQRHRQIGGIALAIVALLVLILAGAGALDGDASGAYRWLPAIYAALLLTGALISWLTPPTSSIRSVERSSS